ncbi:hypothetical protein [Streptomyces sp. WG7]|uniref:hypothetical protein n=1 Tax=Streptomyces sp. WG7 TaxID=3417650 RepID=UPI003CF1241A
MWKGRGLAALGLKDGDVVTERQAELLLGEGRHPDADRIAWRLDRQVAHATGRAIDQDAVALADPGGLHQRLPGSEAGYGQGRDCTWSRRSDLLTKGRAGAITYSA